MRLGAGGVGARGGRDKFAVVQQVLLHSDVLARTGLYATALPLFSAMERVVPGNTVLLMIVSAG